ncbi:ABC transporter permease [Dissulfurirhabdus thermomarina]|uniref:Cell division protein FtsX n=1 Tax=Dissulfurirhabdus thermomarina TaxID=1765737 RepID=A0A6N9TKJ3_DISTH|nr:permease-like cell division protein FtsX [Dissulfurirhabdus thermomarina]NDY41765.1 ABC transporter permease [Dissulfurirhabdus thermomarina]NMX24024.1 ABC transporter permease [Dissulfurirhabdus thermomarina]
MMGVFLRRAASDLRQHLGMQFVTTVVVALSILIFVFFALIYHNLQRFVERFGRELGVVVYLQPDIDQERIPQMYQDLIGLPEVATVRYVSSEEAFKRLQGYLESEPGILEGVDPRIIPPAFEIQIDKAVFNVGRVRELAEKVQKWPGVAQVQYGREWLHRLELFSGFLRAVVAASGLLLLLTATFVVANTIKLTVYARQDELEILRLVGATNAYIQGPFLFEAFLQGFVGSAAALAALYVGYRYVQGLMTGSGLLRDVHLAFLPPEAVAAVVGGSVFLCVLGTALAMRRFLRL